MKELAPGLFSKIVILICFLTLIGFIAGVMFFYWHGRTVPDSLIYSTFTAISVEFLALAWRTKEDGKGKINARSDNDGY